MSKLICNIYRSSKKEGMYLYVSKQDMLKKVPDQLLALFGKPELAMTMLLTPDKPLLRTSADQVMEAIEQQGYYLQMPPSPDEDMQAIAQQNSKLGQL